jgi:hypothetical protein
LPAVVPVDGVDVSLEHFVNTGIWLFRIIQFVNNNGKDPGMDQSTIAVVIGHVDVQDTTTFVVGSTIEFQHSLRQIFLHVFGSVPFVERGESSGIFK